MSAKPIVAATDGSEESLRAVDWAAREAVLRGAPLRIVSAAGLLPRMVEQPGPLGLRDRIGRHPGRTATYALTAATARAAKAAPDLLIDADHLEGGPAEAVTEAGSGALMLVVGSRGVGAFAAHGPRLGQPVRGHPRVQPGRRGPGRDRGRAPAGRDRHRRSGRQRRPRSPSRSRRRPCARPAWWPSTPGIRRSRTSRGPGTALTAPGRSALETEATRQLDGLLDEWREKYPDVPVSHDVVHGHPGRILSGVSARADLVVLGRHPAAPRSRRGHPRGAEPRARPDRHRPVVLTVMPVVSGPLPCQAAEREEPLLMPMRPLCRSG